MEKVKIIQDAFSKVVSANSLIKGFSDELELETTDQFLIELRTNKAEFETRVSEYLHSKSNCGLDREADTEQCILDNHSSNSVRSITSVTSSIKLKEAKVKVSLTK